MVVRLGTLLVLALAPFVAAQNTEEEPAGEKVVAGGPKLFVKERTFDLGIIKEGERKTAKFVLENRGTENLIIDKVRASCGCTVPKKLTEDEKILEPGEILEIEAVFDTKGRKGSQKKTVTITSNDPDEPRLKLFLTANVVQIYEMIVKGRPNSRALRFGSVRSGQEIKDGIDLLPTAPDTTIEILEVKLGSPSLTYTTEPLNKDDRNGYRIKLQVEEDAPIGPIHTSAQFKFKVGDDIASAKLSLSGDISGELKFRPAELKQMQPNLPGKQLAPVSVTSQSRTPFEILRVDAGPNLVAKAEARHGKYDYAITLRIKEDATPGPLGTFLNIYTSSIKQPLIRIPVYANVAARVSAEPAAVLLRKDGNEKSSSRRVKLRAFRRSQELNITNVSTDLAYITVEQIESKGTNPGSRYLRISANDDAPLGKHEGTVRVAMSMEGQVEILIPVMLIVTQQGAQASSQ